MRNVTTFLKVIFVHFSKDNETVSFIKLLDFCLLQGRVSAVSIKCVVICSKFITFAVTKTTVVTLWRTHIVLWFAQNSLPLRWQRQPWWLFHDPRYCCDLLKIHYLCGDKDNSHGKAYRKTQVVICSKFITFAVTKTTHSCCRQHQNRLWFAQNSLPLRWQRQLFICIKLLLKSCDLLKIHYLCGDKDNRGQDYNQGQQVVICSKFITFAVTKTTHIDNGRFYR